MILAAFDNVHGRSGRQAGAIVEERDRLNPKNSANQRAIENRWVQLCVVAVLAIVTSLSSSVVRGSARIAYPGSTDCARGCDFVAGGWPFFYLVDNPGISPRGSISLIDGLTGSDIVRAGPLCATLIFWACVWAALIWVARRSGLLRSR